MLDLNEHRALLGIGLYTLPEAALLIGARPRTVRRWMLGYDYGPSEDRRHVDPLWQPDLPEPEGGAELSFRDLIELRFVRAFVSAGIGLKAIRHCLDYAAQCVGSDRPFSSARFRTDGKTIFLESLEAAGDPQLLDLRRKQYAFQPMIERTFRDLDLEDGIVTRWRPFKGKDSIIVDPGRSFGQPIATASGVPTVALADAVKAEGSVERVAALYEVDRAVVRDAVSFQTALAAT